MCGRVTCRTKCFLKGDSPRGRQRPPTGRALPAAPALPPTKPCPLTQEAGRRPPLYELAFGAGLPEGAVGGKRSGGTSQPLPGAVAGHLPDGQAVPFLREHRPRIGQALADRTVSGGVTRARAEIRCCCLRKNLSLFHHLTPHGLIDPVNRGLTKVIYCVTGDILYWAVN